MNIPERPLDELLEQALSISDRVARDKWLQETLGNDPPKLDELRSLIFSSEKTLWIDTPLHLVQEELRQSALLEGVWIGSFELLRCIGSGGMGEVYLAQQHHPVERLVAIKVIHRDLESVQNLERFKSEQQTLANMEHPNIARIIDAGVTDSGAHYIAMEYVPGDLLLDYVRSRGLDVQQKIHLMMQICLAIQHAHQKGTIHRDIKPSNVLVSVVDGKPLVKVIDFGVAKAFTTNEQFAEFSESEPALQRTLPKGTVTGVSPGTPRFMSPEQYVSSGGGIDTRSDIYSLGALLYNVLVDVPPFDDVPVEELSLQQLKESITRNDPIPPSLRSKESSFVLQGDLDAIILKSMKRDPEDRYKTVGELYDDLQAYLNDLPVKANPGSTWHQAKKFARRHKVFLAGAALAITGLLTGLIFSTIQSQRATESEVQAKRRAYGSDLLLASMAASKRNFALSQELLGRQAVQARSVVGGAEGKPFDRLDWNLLNSQLPQEPTTIGQFPTKLYFGISLPDRDEVACGAKDSRLRIVNRKDGRLRLNIDTEQKEINGLARSPDGQVIATGGDDGTVKFWGVDSGSELGEFQASTDSIYQLAWTSDGKHFVTTGPKANVSVWSIPNYEFVQELDSANEALECLQVGPQGQVAYGSDRGVVRIAYLRDREPVDIQSLSAFTSRAFDVNRVSTVEFSKTGKLLAVGLNNGYLILLRERESTYHVVERVRFSTTVTAIAFSSDESKIALGEDNGSVHLMNLPEDWPTTSRLRFTKYFIDENAKKLPEIDVSNPETLWSFVSMSEPIDPASVIPLDVDRVYLEFQQPLKNIFFSDNYVREWTDEFGRTKPEWKEIPKEVVFKGDGIELQFENRYRGWSDLNLISAQGRLVSWSPHAKRIASLRWDTSGNRLISFSEDGAIRTLQTNVYGTMKVGGDDIKAVTPLSNGRIVLLNANDQACVMELNPNHNEPISSIEFPHGSILNEGVGVEKSGLILCSVRNGTSNSNFTRQLEWWDTKSAATAVATQFDDSFNFRFLIGKLPGSCVAILATEKPTEASNSQLPMWVASWDLKSRKMRWKTIGRKALVSCTVVSSNGKYVAYLEDRKLQIVDGQTGAERTLGDFAGMHVPSICFSRDEHYLVAAVSDNSLICYETQSGRVAWNLRTAGSPIRDVAWSKDLVTLVGVSQEGYLRTFDTGIAQMTSEILVPVKNPIGVKLSPEEDWIYILGRDGTLVRLPCGKPRN